MKKHYGERVFVQSCGISKGELDDLMVSIMREVGADMSAHDAQSLKDLHDSSFDLVIAFTEAAGAAAEAAFAGSDADIQLWPLPDPTAGALDVRAIMDNYRSIRSNIERRLFLEFGEPVITY